MFEELRSRVQMLEDRLKLLEARLEAKAEAPVVNSPPHDPEPTG